MASEVATAMKATVRQMRDELMHAGAAGPASLADLRAADATMGDATGEPDAVTYASVSANGVPALWVTPQGAEPTRTMLYLHGGGYVIGSSATHRKMVGHLAKAAGCRALVVDYRLAPEHPHPAAVQDAVAAYRFLLEQGNAPSAMVVAGDSAGGGLTVALLVSLRDAGVTLPAAAMALSPWVDLEGTGESVTTRAEVDLMVTPALTKVMTDLYMGGQDLRQPTASPLYADLRGLPPLYVQVGDEETLLDDSTRLVARARAAGVEASLDVFPEMWHVFQLFAGFLPEADDAVVRLGAFARRHTS